MSEYEVGDRVIIDLKKARSGERTSEKFTSSGVARFYGDKRYIEVEITKIAGGHDYKVTPIEYPEDYGQYIFEEWIEPSPCECGQEKLYNQNLDEYFCPFCENED